MQPPLFFKIMKVLVIVISLLLIFPAYAEYNYISISDPDADLLNWVEFQGFDYRNDITTGALDIYLPDERLSEIDFKGYKYKIIITESELRRDIAGYRTYSEVTAELNQLALDYPDITYLYSLGKSQGCLYYDGGNNNYSGFQHEIWCLKVSDNPFINEDEPNVFFAANIHGNELISLEVDMEIIYHVLENYAIEDSVADWVNSTQIWFIPLINPDGHRVTVDFMDHRKNMRDNDGDGYPDNTNTDGVDLNRNFDFSWLYSSNYGASNYGGPNPWSEPESTYQRDLLQDHKFFAGITYHSFGEVVLYPLGHESGALAADHEAMEELAEDMAATIPGIYGGYYNAQPATTYLAHGSMGDWGYGVARIYSFTIELSVSPYYHPPAAWVEQICEANVQAALIMLDRVNYATVTGNVTDNDGNPLEVEVYVPEIDSVLGLSEVDPVKSDITYGRYYRLLLPGNYDFRFRCPGFDDIVYQQVPVYDDAVTVLDVVFGMELVSGLLIDIVGDTVYLSWSEEIGFDYNVLSSLNPYQGYAVDDAGFFTGNSAWQRAITDEKRFFRVQKIPR